MIGKLLYLTNFKLNISYSIRVCNRFMTKPQVLHLDVIKQVFRYFKCTVDHGILFKKNGFKKIEGFIDVDWVGDQENRGS